MSMTRQQLRQRIARNLGAGMVKIELCTEQLDDAINTARDLWITYAVGNATIEVYFLLLLKARQFVYDMPAGLIEVIGYEDKMGGIGVGGYQDSFGGYGASRWYTGPEGGNTAFFAIQNPEWQGLGYNNFRSYGSANPINGMYTMVDRYLALSNLDLWRKMRHDKYQWRYHRFTNQLELVPPPDCGNQLQVGSNPPSAAMGPSATHVPNCPGQFQDYETVDSPGYVMIRGQMMEGCSLPTYTPSVTGANDQDATSLYPDADANHLEYIYSHPWIIEYATAYSQKTLGLIRRKFANNTSLGNASLSLDGDSLYSEGVERMRELEEELDLKWSYEGYGISVG